MQNAAGKQTESRRWGKYPGFLDQMLAQHLRGIGINMHLPDVFLICGSGRNNKTELIGRRGLGRIIDKAQFCLRGQAATAAA